MSAVTDIASLLPGALAIAVKAILESVAVTRGIRGPGERAIDTNQKLLTTPAANVAGSFFQTLPAAGGARRAPSRMTPVRAHSSRRS